FRSHHASTGARPSCRSHPHSRERRLQKLTTSDPELRGRTGSGVIVAVLDSGVRVPHPHLPAVAECVAIDPSHGDGIDRLGHGTAVASAIHDIAPGATLIVGKVFDRSLATNVAV